MIARMWRGRVRTERLAEYVDIVERTGLAGYRRTPGNAGAQRALFGLDLDADVAEAASLADAVTSDPERAGGAA